MGFGEACRVAKQEMAVRRSARTHTAPAPTRRPQADERHVRKLSKRLYDRITAELDEVVLNGDAVHRYPGNLNISFAYVEGESLLMSLKEVAVSSGSACTSASLEPSYVLRALGVEEDMAHTSLRFGLGRFTTEVRCGGSWVGGWPALSDGTDQAEVDFAADTCIKHVKRLRDMSPLYEMVKEGVDIRKIQWTH